jgi:hypothetical protein
VKPAARRLRAALAAVLVQADAPELALVHRWLDNWRGVGLLAVGLHRVRYDLQLTQYGDGHWRASFYVTGVAHSILGGSAWEPTPWTAVQMAAWAPVRRSAWARGGLEDFMTPRAGDERQRAMNGHGRETWVCYEHRRTAKVKLYTREPRCPDCRQPMVNLGKKARIPKRDDGPGWQALRTQFPRSGRAGSFGPAST